MLKHNTVQLPTAQREFKSLIAKAWKNPVFQCKIQDIAKVQGLEVKNKD